MSKLRKLSYVVGAAGVGLIFAGIKIPILSLAGFVGVFTGLVVYTADKYLCSSGDMIVDIQLPEEEMKMPPNLAREIEPDRPNNEVYLGANITYQYDVLAGQWDTNPPQFPESDADKKLSDDRKSARLR
jgi:hypothetical protein